MAEEDNLNGLEQITGSPCDDIDLAEMFESDIGIRDEQNHVDDKGSGSEFDSEREEHVELLSSENEHSDGFPSLEGYSYGVTPPRDVRRQKERSRKGKEKVQGFLKNSFGRESGPNSSEKAELHRRIKRGSTQLTTERAFQRKLKRGSVDVSFNVNFDSGVRLPDCAKSLEIPSIKIESASRFMSLDCVCEDTTDGSPDDKGTGGIPMKATMSRSHPRATRSESDPRSAKSRSYLNPNCPETRMEFYRTFSLLIKLGSLAHNQQDSQKQQVVGNTAERQNSEENKKWQVELSQALWLELQAWHANRTMDEQDMHLVRARAEVEKVLDEVINFKVKKPDHTTEILSDVGDTTAQDGNSEESDNNLNVNGSNDSETNEAYCQSCSVMQSHISSSTYDSEKGPEGNQTGCHDSSLDIQEEENATTQENEQLTSSKANDSDESFFPNNSTDMKAVRRKLWLDLNKESPNVLSKEPSIHQCNQTLKDRSCCKLKAAIEQVAELFDKVERVEHLYPTCKSLGEQNPKYRSEEFTRNFETLCLWLNVTSELYHKLHLVAKFVGVDLNDTETWKDWLDIGLGRLGK